MLCYELQESSIQLVLVNSNRVLNIGPNFNPSLKNPVFIRDLVIEKNNRNVKRMPVSLEVGKTRCSERDKSMYFRAMRLQCGTASVRIRKCRYDVH